jgi:hypothetical protein
MEVKSLSSSEAALEDEKVQFWSHHTYRLLPEDTSRDKRKNVILCQTHYRKPVFYILKKIICVFVYYSALLFPGGTSINILFVVSIPENSPVISKNNCTELY